MDADQLKDSLKQLQGAIAVAKESGVCPRCDGKGVVHLPFVPFRNTTTCPACRGTGRKPCR